ncbi:MAG: septum formation inhibitor Maf [Proteobacteria bacterium]|nr:septum formation inhibitor Maf [Pseudomonadota bacterium]
MHYVAVKPPLILASSSPRRRELLNQVGMAYQVIVADIDESIRPGEDAGEYVCRMAREKALEVHQRDGVTVAVLGADTAVVVNGRVLGKPVDREDAIRMLESLSGRTHEVWSAVALVSPGGGLRQRLNITRVTLSELDRAWIESYCDSGEPMDKAGAYGVQGIAAQKISHMEGSYSGVMGLPLHETAEILQAAGVLNKASAAR